MKDKHLTSSHIHILVRYVGIKSHVHEDKQLHINIFSILLI